METKANQAGQSTRVRDMVRSKPSISVVVDSMLGNKPAEKVQKAKASKQIQSPPTVNTQANLPRKIQRPTLLRDLDKKEEAKVHVANAHATLTKASVHADFNRKAQAHKNARLGFTRTPMAIQNLIS